MDSECENIHSDNAAVDDPSSPSQPASIMVPPSPPAGQQPMLTQAETEPTFTFTFPQASSSSKRPVEQKGGRCSVCTKALCPRRHDCKGSVNRAWCRHGHAPLRANEKIRWSEAEVERRIADSRVQFSQGNAT